MSEYVDGAFYWCRYGDGHPEGAGAYPARWFGPRIDPAGDAGSYFQPWGYEDDFTWPVPDEVGPMIEPPPAEAWHVPEHGPHTWLRRWMGIPDVCADCDVQWSPERATEPCPRRIKSGGAS